MKFVYDQFFSLCVLFIGGQVSAFHVLAMVWSAEHLVLF